MRKSGPGLEKESKKRDRESQRQRQTARIKRMEQLIHPYFRASQKLCCACVFIVLRVLPHNENTGAIELISSVWRALLLKCNQIILHQVVRTSLVKMQLNSLLSGSKHVSEILRIYTGWIVLFSLSTVSVSRFNTQVGLKCVVLCVEQKHQQEIKIQGNISSFIFTL